MATKYNIDTFSKGVNGFGLPFCDTVYSVTLGANTAASVTVPGASADFSDSIPKYIAVFSFVQGSSVYATINGTAVVPAGNSLAATTSELLNLDNAAKYVKAGDVISIISAHAATDVSIALYLFEAI
jgi:phosphosulfolactate phosphohydrolase-like enzyme